MSAARWDDAREIAVLGFGLTGRAVCEYAIGHSIRPSASEADALRDEDRTWLRRHGIAFEDGGHSLRFVEEADAVILSPGVPIGLPVLDAARDRGIPVLSEIDFALRFLEDPVVVAVTGTNGKSSTVEGIAAVLRGFGRVPRVAGNIGVPLISLVDEILESDVIVLEISSYQLEQSRGFRPHIGVLLNLSPDHLQRHGSLSAYAAAKAKLFTHQTPRDVAVLPSHLAEQFDGGSGRRVFFDLAFETLPDGAGALFPHEQANLRATMAACAALLPEFDPARVPMDDVIAAFRLPHRMQTIGYIHGARAINDSKSTNADSAIAALRCMTGPTILLVGGRSKQEGYDRLAREVAASTVRKIITFGEAASSLMDVLASHPDVAPIVTSEASMDDAVARAIHDARQGDTILLSPACSSFDAYVNYAERGDAFAALVRSHPTFTDTPART